MRPRFTPLLLVLAFVGSACFGPLPRGFATFCYADSDNNVSGFESSVDVVHTGVRRVAPDESLGTPDALFECGEPRNVAELVSDAGTHLWLAVDVTVAEESVLPARLFDLVDDATVEVVVDRVFPHFASSAVVRNGDRVVLALQSDAPLRSPAGGLVVSDDGAGAPRTNYCADESPVSLRFVDDDGAENAAFGESVDLVVDGADVRAINFASIAYGPLKPRTCSDVPNDETLVGWVAFDSPR